MDQKILEASQLTRDLHKEAETMPESSLSREILMEEIADCECFVADVEGEAAMHRRDVPCLPKPFAHHKWVVCEFPGCIDGKKAFVMRIGAMGCHGGHGYRLRYAYEREVREIVDKRNSSEPVS